LIAGAGPIGLAVAAFAQIAGANVIMMDINQHRLEFCREQQRIKYTINALEEDILFRLKTITNEDMPSVVIDATGIKKAI